MTKPDKTTFEVLKTTNARAGILQLQLGLKTRDAILNFLLDYYHEKELTKQSNA